MGVAADSGQDLSRTTIGVLADPDLPSDLARSLADIMPGRLGERLSGEAEWTVDRARDPFESMFPDVDRFVDKAYERVRETGWDLSVALTDLPLRRATGRVVLAEVKPPQQVILISVPALGGVNVLRRLRRLVVALVVHLRRTDVASCGAAAEELQRELGSFRVHVDDDTDELEIACHGRSGVPRLLAGMVRANRPWRLVVGMSTALAGALTGASFGVLYYSVWLLATVMGPVRLAVAASAAVVVLAGWTIVGHSLWESHGPDSVEWNGNSAMPGPS